MLYMDEGELVLWRVERLRAAIQKLDEGNLNAFGRRMGYADGSYIGQMIRGTRAISEKFVRKFEDDNRLPGWFDPRIDHEGPEYQLLTELVSRQIPAAVINGLLDIVRQYPPKNKVA